MTFLNDWFPNFDLFVLVIAPIIVSILFVMVLISRWLHLKSQAPRVKNTFAELIGYIPVIILFFVFWEILEYLLQVRETVADRLFDYWLPTLTWIIIFIGIAQVLYYFVADWNSERAGGD